MKNQDFKRRKVLKDSLIIAGGLGVLGTQAFAKTHHQQIQIKQGERMQTRFEKGLKQLQSIDGEAGSKVISSLEDIAPDLGRFIIEFAFGDIYTRGELNLQEREMITLSSLLTVGGCEAQLEVHINAALNVGISKEKIIECLMQCIPYTGFPKVLNAVFVAKKVFKEKL